MIIAFSYMPIAWAHDIRYSPVRVQPDTSARWGFTMKWVTRKDVKVDRVACPWLITRFIDEDAEFGFVPADKVLEVAEREGGYSFDAPGARYGHGEGTCTFEVLIDQYRLIVPGLDYLAKIVHAADIQGAVGSVPEGPGLKAVAEAFALTVESDIERQRWQWPIYDALLVWCAAHEERAATG
jgi:hypothetical protein